MSPHTGQTTLDATRTVRVSYNPHGPWDVVLAGDAHRLTCETLDDAKRIANQVAERKRPCELIVCDAYRRVVRHEVIGDPARGRPTGDLVPAEATIASGS
jgi:hypothetical protein